MKTIHIAGAGGPAGVGMTRCLRETYDVQGHDGSVWGELMMECKPETSGVGIHYADMIVPVPDPLVAKYAEHANCFLPPKSHIDLCQDKAKTAEVLGNLAPKTYWVRDTVGAGGKGAQMASEYLPGRNVSVEVLSFDKDTDSVLFMKERLSYKVGKREDKVNGIGTSAVSICIFDEQIRNVALDALNKVQEATGETFRGVYAVDLKQAEDGTFKVTEINAGRFLTASYPYFYKTGYNLPLLMCQHFLGEELSPLPEYPEGWGLVWQLGQEPKLCPPGETISWKEAK